MDAGWMMMCHYGHIQCKKGTALLGDTEMGKAMFVQDKMVVGNSCTFCSGLLWT